MYTTKDIKADSYVQFLENLRKENFIRNNNVKEGVKSLIELPTEYHIVSPIAKQYNFSTGINYELRKKFGNNQILLPSEIGDITYFKDNNRYIMFLVNKNKDKQKATYEDMYTTLINLRSFSLVNNINKLAMEKLGEPDNLEWKKIKSMLRYIFTETKIEIFICTTIEYTEEEKLIILQQFHDSELGGHLGINKTLKMVKKQFNWKGINNDVREYINNCTFCQKNKITNREVRQPMAITTISSRPFKKLFLSIIGPLTTTLSGNKYILIMQDDLTKYSLGVPIPNQEANTVARAFVTRFVCINGIPETILTDQSTAFWNNTFTKICKLFKIINIHTSPLHIQTNGSLKRFYRTLYEYLRHYVNKNLNNWDNLLPYAFFVYNSTEHSSTGHQPHLLVFGQTLKMPVQLKSELESRYTYDDYFYDLKQNLQKMHKIARERNELKEIGVKR